MVKYSSCLSSIFFRDLLNPVKYITVSFNLPSIAFFPVPCKIKIAFQIFLRIAIQDQRSVVLSYDKVWDAFPWKQGIRSVFQRIQKIRTLPLSEKVRILLLWCTSRDSNPGPTDQEKPTCNDRQFPKLRGFVVFYRFIVNLCFASAASFEAVIFSCIRYPTIPVCKNVQSQNQPLKTGIGFFCKAGKTAGFEPDMAATISPV